MRQEIDDQLIVCPPKISEKKEENTNLELQMLLATEKLNLLMLDFNDFCS